MRLQPLLLTLGALAASTALACGGGDSAEPEPTAAPSATETPAPTATVEASTQLAPGRPVRSPDGSLTLSTASGSPLTVLVTKVANVPAAPAGWTIPGPAFDITARSGDRVLTQLESPIDLSFKAPAGPALVVYHDGKSWVPVESMRNADGTLGAKTNHLTPFAVAVPKAGSSPIQHEGFERPTATASPSATTSATALASATSSTSATGSPSTSASPSVSSTPSASATVVDSKKAEAALEKAGMKFTGRATDVSDTLVYEASIIGGHITEVFAGYYGGVNEIITTGATNRDDSGDSYTFLLEPKMAMPVSTRDAQEQLVKLFPGATGVRYRVVEESPTRYVFKIANGEMTSMMGFVSLNGVPVAFMAMGTGPYYYPVDQLTLE